MTQARLALYTFGMFRQPAEHPANAGFHERNDPIFVLIKGCSGFLGHAGYDDDPAPELWGEQVFPRFYVERGDGWSPSTLSLWEDAEAAMAFAYSGLHAEALRRGREWFEAPQWPPYAAWWVGPRHRPDWREAVARHEHLHDHGPGPDVFDFKTAFAPDGRPTKIDRARLKARIAENARRSSPLAAAAGG